MKNYRKTKFYKNLTPYLATGLAEGFEEGTSEEQLIAWQYLHDTQLAYKLQGWFGRKTQYLIANGAIIK